MLTQQKDPVVLAYNLRRYVDQKVGEQQHGIDRINQELQQHQVDLNQSQNGLKQNISVLSSQVKDFSSKLDTLVPKHLPPLHPVSHQSKLTKSGLPITVVENNNNNAVHDHVDAVARASERARRQQVRDKNMNRRTNAWKTADHLGFAKNAVVQKRKLLKSGSKVDFEIATCHKLGISAAGYTNFKVMNMRPSLRAPTSSSLLRSSASSKSRLLGSTNSTGNGPPYEYLEPQTVYPMNVAHVGFQQNTLPAATKSTPSTITSLPYFSVDYSNYQTYAQGGPVSYAGHFIGSALDTLLASGNLPQYLFQNPYRFNVDKNIGLCKISDIVISDPLPWATKLIVTGAPSGLMANLTIVLSVHVSIEDDTPWYLRWLGFLCDIADFLVGTLTIAMNISFLVEMKTPLVTGPIIAGTVNGTPVQRPSWFYVPNICTAVVDPFSSATPDNIRLFNNIQADAVLINGFYAEGDGVSGLIADILMELEDTGLWVPLALLLSGLLTNLIQDQIDLIWDGTTKIG